MTLSARLRIAFLTICILLLMPFVVIKARSQTANGLYPQTDTNVPHNLNTFTQGLLINISDSLICQIAGVSAVNPNHECLTTNPLTGVLGFAKITSPNMPGGAIGQVSALIADTYSIPIHTSDYVSYMASNFGLVKNKALAAAQNPNQNQQTYGVGFSGISPLMTAWITFRNIVYLLYAIVFVIIGAAIMLRLKIDPRTVMTIENSLPKVIVSLLLVTFSFAIAGLLIDVMWIAVFLIINIISSIDPVNSGSFTGMGISAGDATGRLFSNVFGYTNTVLNTGGPSGFLSLPADAARGIQEVISSLFLPNSSANLGLYPQVTCNWTGIGGWAKCVLGTTVGEVIGDVISYLLSWVIGAVAFLVILIAVLVSLVKLWLQLIQCYLLILFDIVTAPFWILGGALPGGKNGFELWLRDMLGWLMPFPIVIAFFLLGKVFIDTFGNKNISTLFVPPLIGNPNIGTGAGTGAPGVINNPIGAIIGVALILAAPQSVKVARETFKSPGKPWEYLTGVFQSVGIGTKALSGVVKTVVGAVTQEEVTYKSGTPQTIKNPLERLYKRFTRQQSQ